MLRFFTFWMLLVSALPCSSQTIEVGIYGGGGLSRLYNARVKDFYEGIEEPAAVPAAGVFVGLTTPNGLGVGAELGWASAVQRYGHDGVTNENKDKDKIGYLDISLLARKTFRSGLFVEAGPKASLPQDARTVVYNYWPFDTTYTLHTAGSYHRMILSCVAGVGTSLAVTNRLSATARLRVAVALTDATRQFSKEQFYAASRAGEISWVSSFAHWRVDTSLPTEYSKTTVATLHALAGLTYRFSAASPRPVE